MRELILILWTMNFFCSCNSSSYADDVLKPKTIDAIVIKKYEVRPGCFGEIVFKEKNSLDTIKEVCYCVVDEQKIYDYILPNDSLSKAAGSLKITVIRNGIRKEFDFPFCIE